MTHIDESGNVVLDVTREDGSHDDVTYDVYEYDTRDEVLYPEWMEAT